MSSIPDLSIVIPAYNEEARLPRSLGRIFAYLADRRIDAEVIVVSDGSSDGTADIVRSMAGKHPNLRLLSNRTNHGKGSSVRSGMLAARGKVTLFTDADLSAPIEEADKLLEVLCDRRYDAAIGSRAVDRSLIKARQSRFRELAGIIFNRLVRLMTSVPFVDTQCGFKAFQTEKSRILFKQQRIEGFGFDPEILFLAKQHGLRVAEIPVEWHHDPGTKVKVFSDSLRMVLALLSIRWNSLVGRYPTEEAAAKVRVASKC